MITYTRVGDISISIDSTVYKKETLFLHMLVRITAGINALSPSALCDLAKKGYKSLLDHGVSESSKTVRS